MKDLTFNEWQENLSKQLENDYLKLKLIRNEKKTKRESLISKNKV
jgi:tRNA A37 threonylcarbamoyladenosine biosynthesis protein TsaE